MLIFQGVFDGAEHVQDASRLGHPPPKKLEANTRITILDVHFFGREDLEFRSSKKSVRTINWTINFWNCLRKTNKSPLKKGFLLG